MTTSIYNAAAAQPVRAEPQPVESAKETVTKRRHTIASRLVFLTLCVGLVLTTLFYGTVHYWALAAGAVAGVDRGEWSGRERGVPRCLEGRGHGVGDV